MPPDTVPHVSLAKPRDKQWKDDGFFVKQCVDADDWVPSPSDLGASFSPSLHAFKQLLPLRGDALRSVFFISDTNSWSKDELSFSDLHAASLTPGDISPLLAQVPTSLWATHKYDVGLSNCSDHSSF